VTEVLTIETTSLGDRSYIAHDGETAVVVDPQRDIDRVLAPAAEHGVRIAGVLETHVHNDYVSGGLELARATGADYGTVLDVRTPAEFETAHIRGSYNVPLNLLAEHAEQIAVRLDRRLGLPGGGGSVLAVPALICGARNPARHSRQETHR
jgi:glyoxylase-like metal-dependent hydrolase (beta-lactamase superfamily II)